MKDNGLCEKERKKVLTFEGYGNKDAPFWFLGMEEGGGSMEQFCSAPLVHFHSALDRWLRLNVWGLGSGGAIKAYMAVVR